MKTLALVLVCAYCSLQARSLWGAWVNDPQNHWGGVSFGVWLAWVVFLNTRLPAGLKPSMPLMIAALAAVTLGAIGELNVLMHIGLALSLAASGHSPATACGIIAAAVGWLPATGWLIHQSGVDALHGLRPLPVLALAAVYLTLKAPSGR